MPSSISNSNTRTPNLDYRKFWVTTILFLVVILAGLELASRRIGFLPSIGDTKAQWALSRQRVDSVDPRHSVVVLGASRAQLGFSPQGFEEAAPGYEVVFLAKNGHDPIPTLEDLAQKSRYSGLVVMSYHPGFELFVSGTQLDYVQYYHSKFSRWQFFEQRINYGMNKWLQGTFVVCSPTAPWKNLTGRRLKAPYSITQRNRFRKANYHDMTEAEQRKSAEKRLVNIRKGFDLDPTVDKAEYVDKTRRVREAIEIIQQRGGDVVLVRFPSAGEHLEIERTKYPKTEYWDKVAVQTGATTISWEDTPSLSAFECVDLSHLDYRDAQKFTALLAQELRQKGFLQ